MAWRQLTEDDYLTGMSGPETGAYKRAALQAGQTDVLAAIMLQATHEARGHIADCAQNQLAAGDTLPERIIIHVLAIVRYRMATRLGIGVSDARTVEYRESRRFLERVSDCKVAIEDPVGAVSGEDQSSAGSLEVVAPTGDRLTKGDFNGI